MRSVVVLGGQVPFNRGGQDALVNSLLRALTARGYCADLVQIPLSIPRKDALLDQIHIWRSLDLSMFSGRKVDAVICTKFPTYFANHPRKSLWLVHQQRSLYELFGTRFSDFSDDPRDEALRRMVIAMDKTALSECLVKTTISHTVSHRMSAFLGLDSEPLYPPLPLGDAYYSAASEPFILSVGRICTIKRIDLLIKALPLIPSSMTLKVVGQCDEAGVMEYISNEIAKHHLTSRVEFLGRVDDKTLLSLYSRCKLVYYAPFDEDYGYVTLEAFASGKPVLTCTDSGGVLEFVTHGITGAIVDSTPEALAQGCKQICSQSNATPEFFLKNTRSVVESLSILSTSNNPISHSKYGWDKIVDTLLPQSLFYQDDTSPLRDT